MTNAPDLTQAAPREIAAADRVLAVDALRGFAVFGILVVNITVFSSPFYGSELPNPTVISAFDHTIVFITSLLFEGKFYLLFSFLFGYSFTLQMRSAERAAKTLRPRILRRQLGLFLIGAVHAVFLYSGDILVTYSVFGLILFRLRNRPDKSLLRLAFWLTAGPAVFWGVAGVLMLNFVDLSESATTLETVQQELAAYRGTIGTVIQQNLIDLAITLPVVILFQGPFALSMFLIGLVTGRRQLLAQPEAFQRLARPMLLLGLVVGLPGSLIYTYTANFMDSSSAVVGIAVAAVTAPLLTGAYVAIAMLVFQTKRGQPWVNWLAPAGRMALSNYILQSLVCCVIFTAYGFRLMNELSPPTVFAVAVIIFALQLVVSRLWLARFSYGPLEWLLRALTNATWPQWRRTAMAA